MRAARDHPVNEDEADRHLRSRRVPGAVAIAIAVLAVALLAYARGAFR